MKKTAINRILFILAIILFIPLGIKASTGDMQHKKITTIKLNSIQCNMCVETITEKLQAVDGVIKVIVDLDNKKAKITYNSDKINVGEIEDVITAAGYDANNKKADPTAYEKLSGCCKVSK